jgi:hypothetical protein
MSQAKTSRKPLQIVDPIFDAIAEHKAREKEFYRLRNELEEATSQAEKEHGEPPPYRGALLRQPGADSEQIEKEYRDANERLAEWEHRAGIAPLREQLEHNDRVEQRAAMRMARTKPTTPAGAAALVEYTRRDIISNGGLADWHMPALKTAANAYRNERGGSAMTQRNTPADETINRKLIEIAVKRNQAAAEFTRVLRILTIAEENAWNNPKDKAARAAFQEARMAEAAACDLDAKMGKRLSKIAATNLDELRLKVHCIKKWEWEERDISCMAESIIRDIRALDRKPRAAASKARAAVGA